MSHDSSYDRNAAAKHFVRTSTTAIVSCDKGNPWPVGKQQAHITEDQYHLSEHSSPVNAVCPVDETWWIGSHYTVHVDLLWFLTRIQDVSTVLRNWFRLHHNVCLFILRTHYRMIQLTNRFPSAVNSFPANIQNVSTTKFSATCIIQFCEEDFLFKSLHNNRGRI